MSQIVTRIAPARHRLILSSCSILALAVVSQPAVAQNAPEDLDDEIAENPINTDVIVVSGFRKSLSSAQTIKENADTVVDVITAEDIGALPDRSIAEALQRVPGVNIGRFEKTSDPDRFSVEGTGVVIRGLPYVRSELNGRDIFSATGGTVLSFNDVSPELLGRIEVFKNVTADMIDGSIAGTVNLVTRKPLDNPGFHIAGSVEANWGDMAKEWSPGYSGIISKTFETPGGSLLGLQFGYAKSELVSRTDASGLQDPCYRDAGLATPCIRTQDVSSAGYGEVNFDETNFPPDNSVIVPKGAGVRTTRLERDREAFSVVGQFESADGRLVATAEWLRADTQFFTDEYFIQALVNNDAGFPIERAGSEWTFQNGLFKTGTLTQVGGDSGLSPWGGLPTELVHFQRLTDSKTEDFSFDASFQPSDRLRLNFELQHITSALRQDSIIGAMNTFSDLMIDNTGSTPEVQFITPVGAPEGIYNDPDYTYYWFLLDSYARNEGKLNSVRFDAEYDVGDGFLKGFRFGTRWAERARITRDTNFQNWGTLGAPWTGRGGNWNCADPQVYGCGGAYAGDFPQVSNYVTPFADDFQRGNVGVPIQNGGGFFFGGDDFISDYLNGKVTEQAQALTAWSFPEFLPEQWTPMPEGFTEGQISDVEELTGAFYARVDYGTNFANGMSVEGNIGLRYVRTTVKSGGRIALPNPADIDDPANNAGGNGDGIVQVSELRYICDNNPNPTAQIGYCELSDARLAEFAAAYTGDVIVDDRNITFDHWLPAFNAKLDFGNGLLLRGAVSKGISRPDLAFYRAGGQVTDNTGDLLAGGSLASGPLFQLATGNRNVQATQSWNYDLSIEYYFDDVGSITLAGFIKDISGIVSSGVNVVDYPTSNGPLEIEVNGPSNELSGTLKGVEVAYQDVFEFLPGFLDGLGTQLTYTYVNAGDFSNVDLIGNRGTFASRQPLQGVSKHTINATLFYEKGPISLRTAYNWRSDFLITPRDDIFPFSPIWQEATGQLDASIFYSVSGNVKLGIQGVNLLDEVTQTSQVIDFDGTRLNRNAFRNDRRFTFLARIDF